MTKHTYELNGIEGVPAIAMRFGIPVSTIKNRLARGLTIEEAVAKTNLRRNQPRQFKKRASVRFPDKLSALWCLALGVSA